MQCCTASYFNSCEGNPPIKSFTTCYFLIYLRCPNCLVRDSRVSTAATLAKAKSCSSGKWAKAALCKTGTTPLTHTEGKSLHDAQHFTSSKLGGSQTFCQGFSESFKCSPADLRWAARRFFLVEERLEWNNLFLWTGVLYAHTVIQSVAHNDVQINILHYVNSFPHKDDTWHQL